MPGNVGKNIFPGSTKTTSSHTMGGALKETSAVDLSPSSDLGHPSDNGSDTGSAVRLVKPADVNVDKRTAKAASTRSVGAQDGKLSDWADVRNRYGGNCTCDGINAIFGQDKEGGGSILPAQSLLGK